MLSKNLGPSSIWNLRTTNSIKTRGVPHCGLGPFTLKSILRQKKNYGNSNISACKNIIFKKTL
jgi:hypothetical protein